MKKIKRWLNISRSMSVEDFLQIKKLEDVDYTILYNFLCDTVENCTRVSQNFGGIPSPTGSHYYASVLFTTLCVRSHSLITLIPKRVTLKNRNWDQASIGSVLRAILEIRLCFFYLCVEDVTDEEWQCRWNIMNLHDCTRRTQLFKTIWDDENEVAGHEKTKEDLKKRLINNEFFKELDEKKKKLLLKGKDAFMYPLSEVAEKSGFPEEEFKSYYAFLSNYLHGLPMSFYRVGESDRGRGIYCLLEEFYIKWHMAMANSMLLEAQREMIEKFKDVKTRKTL